MIEIDGSFGEGGGQILRSCLALAAVLGKEVRIFNIRARRSEPGLKAQHLTSALAVSQLCKASSRGLEIGSTEFVFKPGRIIGGFFSFDIGTAGSVTLMLQALMPLLPFATSEISLELLGGTDVKWSPPIDYLKLVTLPLLKGMGIAMSLQVDRRGHYPRGGGLVRVSSNVSGSLNTIVGRERGGIKEISGISHVVKLPRHIAERQATSASRLLEKNELAHPKIVVDASEGDFRTSPGSGIVVSAATENGSILGGDCLGERGLPAEEVGRVASERLVDAIRSRSFLDKHMGDIIVPYMALAQGLSEVSVSEITQHTLTNMKVAEVVGGVQFDPPGDLGRPGTLRVKGLGLKLGEVSVSPTELRSIRDP